MISKEKILTEFYSRTGLFAKYSLDYSIETDKYIERLRNVKIAVTGKREILSSFNGQNMLLMSINLLSRFCMNIDLIMPHDIKAIIDVPLLGNNSLSSELVKIVKGINPFNEIGVMESTEKRYDVVIAIGGCSVVLGRTVFINSDGWLSYANTEDNSMQWVSNNHNPIGAYVAACIGVAELFKMIFAQFKQSRYIGSLVFSAFDYGFKHNAFVNPSLPNEIAMATIHFVSMGAINSGVLYTLCAVPGIRGNVVMIEPDKLDVSNLNRYAFSFAQDASEHLSKIESAIKFIGSRLTIESTFSESYKNVSKTFEQVDFAVVGVDNVEARWDVQSDNPRNIICGGTVIDRIQLSMHKFRRQGACLKCFYPELFPGGEEPIPTISFVSFLAGVLMAGEIIKYHIKDYSSYVLNNVLDLSLLNSSLFTQRYIRQSKDCQFCTRLNVRDL